MMIRYYLSITMLFMAILINAGEGLNEIKEFSPFLSDYNLIPIVYKDSQQNKSLIFLSLNRMHNLKKSELLTSSFTKGKAVVSTGNGSYILNTNGDSLFLKDLFLIDYDKFGFHEFVVPVFSKKKRSAGFINMLGEFVIPAKYGLAKSFAYGLAPVRDIKTKKWGYINHQGEVVIPFQYTNANSFSDDGIAAVQKSTKGGWQFINVCGKEISKDFNSIDTYIQVGEFIDGLCPVKSEYCEYWHYIDSMGAAAFKEKFKVAYAFSEGKAVVSLDGKTYGYINIKGKMVIPAKYNNALSFHNGIALVSFSQKYKIPIWDMIINARGEGILTIENIDMHALINKANVPKLSKDGGGA